MSLAPALTTALPLIDGVRAPTAAGEFDDQDPSSGEVLARIARCGPDEVDWAVGAARAALDRTWRASTHEDRARFLRRMAEEIRADREQLALLECLDTGKPISQARNDVAVAARYFEFYAGTIEGFYGPVLLSNADSLSFALLEPYGVCGHIIPWNYPLQVACRTLAPALATGNCSVVKPAEDAPLSVLRLGELALSAGLPPGVLNIVPGLGDEAGRALAAHAGIDHLAFTGSRLVGREVMAAAAANVTPVSLELGGKSPHLVFRDADADAVLAAVTSSIIEHAGQNCAAGSRLLVHEAVHDRLVDSLVDRFAGLSIGAGIADPEMGPLINARQRDRVLRFCDIGRREARLRVGGGAPCAHPVDAGGYFVAPTLFDDVHAEAVIAQEEIFGPVLAVTTFRDDGEALRLANGTPYGLSAAVWTADLGRALSVAGELRVSQVFVNGYSVAGGVELPFGGCKQSGFGREKGLEALRAYTQVKAVTLSKHAARRP